MNARAAIDRPLPVFAALLLFYSGALILLGRGVASDEVGYSLWGDALLHGHPIAGSRDYIGFVLLVAAAKFFAGAHWAAAIVALNVVATAAAGTLVVAIVRETLHRRLPCWIALALYVGSFDLLLWMRYAITDSIFTAISVATLASCVFAMTRRRPVYWLSAILLCGIAVPFRQSGVVMLPIAAAAAAAAIARRPPLRLLYALLVIGVAGACAAADYVLLHPAATRAGAATAVRLRPYFDGGVVVDARPETHHERPRNLSDAAALNAARLMRFFQFATASFGRMHNAMNVLYYVPLYFLALVALVRFVLWRGSPESLDVVFVMAVAVSIFAFSRALTFVDFDWRYRLPAIPPLIVMASVAGDALLAKFSRRHGASEETAAAAHDARSLTFLF